MCGNKQCSAVRTRKQGPTGGPFASKTIPFVIPFHMPERYSLSMGPWLGALARSLFVVLLVAKCKRSAHCVKSNLWSEWGSMAKQYRVQTNVESKIKCLFRTRGRDPPGSDSVGWKLIQLVRKAEMTSKDRTRVKQEVVQTVAQEVHQRVRSSRRLAGPKEDPKTN